MELSQPQMILLAADRLSMANGTSFSASDLVCSAYEAHRDVFGLEGYEDRYPDSNRVLAHVMGQRGMVKKGWLSRVGSKKYALTETGRSLADSLLKREPKANGTHSPKPALCLSKHEEDLFTYCSESDAASKWAEGRKGEISYLEADDFWASDPKSISTQLEELADRLEGTHAVLSTGRVVVSADVRNLIHLSSWLWDRYGKRYT